MNELADPTNIEHPGTNKLAENEEHAATTVATKHSKNMLSKATHTSLDLTDAAPLYTTRIKRKRKSNSSHDHFMEIIKMREQQRRESFSTIYQQTQISNDGTIKSLFCEHIRSVLQTLPRSLTVQAKSEINNILSKYALEAVKINVQYNNNYSSPPSTTNSLSSPIHRNESSLSGYTVTSNLENSTPCYSRQE